MYSVAKPSYAPCTSWLLLRHLLRLSRRLSLFLLFHIFYFLPFLNLFSFISFHLFFYHFLFFFYFFVYILLLFLLTSSCCSQKHARGARASYHRLHIFGEAFVIDIFFLIIFFSIKLIYFYLLLSMLTTMKNFLLSMYLLGFKKLFFVFTLNISIVYLSKLFSYLRILVRLLSIKDFLYIHLFIKEPVQNGTPF